ncbi:LruC domain-containing protein [Grimontia kaedaensis]|uniref:LruC domain-containing protein n=1 Tax=Grimontia kaedaensis TaxID=2872157 RepID=A0ABY4WZ77_9GAMM|nr:LruC domain-containing protein [Grimontia kaedaensis]USH04291.1 LruC domain-containing protein [Grimontia kaedaensis]
MLLRKMLITGGCIFTTCTYALTAEDLVFESGADSSNYSALGKPNDVYSIADQLPQDTLDNVYSMLPEGTVVNPDFIDSGKYSSIDIDDELDGAAYATARVTFLNEGAGYLNVLGYFVFDTANPPASIDDIDTHMIIFPNASKPNQGELLEGDTIDLNVQLNAGQTLGFFILSNAWGWGWGYNSVPYLGKWGTPFYSYPDLNPETTSDWRRHNVAFIDTQNDFLVLAFEDIKRPQGDNDFNDLIFTVEITPFQAIDGVNPDGSTDSKYEVLTQNNNPEITVTSVYPSSNGYATIAFEDNWPFKGDYDFNDVVMRYRITETMNGQRELKSFSADYTLQAMGAGYANGFALHLPNVDPSNIASVSLTRNGQAVSHTVQQANPGETVLIISENVREDVENLGVLSEGCPFYRTQTACLDSQTSKLDYQLNVELTTPVARAVVGYPPYDPFIFATDGIYHGDFTDTPPGISWQLHLKQFSGTSDMNNAFFNTNDDNSGGAESFLTSNNMPWAINIRDEWSHPTENTDISHAFTTFADWVTSSGESDKSWYSAATSGKVIAPLADEE